MENKYYTPEISDIRVGYECEVEMDIITSEGEKVERIWTPFTFKKQNLTIHVKGQEPVIINNVMRYSESMRTPYLTKKQIEAEGWKEVKNESSVDRVRYRFEKKVLDETEPEGEYYLTHTLLFDRWLGRGYTIPSIIIDKEDAPSFYSSGVHISCPSINEFRTINNLLNIR